MRVWISLNSTIIVSFFQVETHSLRKLPANASGKCFSFHKMMTDIGKKVLIKSCLHYSEAAIGDAL